MTFQAEYEQRLATWSDVQYCMPRMLQAALAYPKGSVLELGVRSGNSTSAFLAAAERNGGHVWSVDTEPPEVPAHWHDSSLWTFVQADDLTMDLPQPAFNVIFLDTSHHYSQTLAELERFVPALWPGGCMLLHDTLLGHVDFEPLPYPVLLAVGEYCRTHGLGWTEHGGRTGFAEIRPA